MSRLSVITALYNRLDLTRSYLADLERTLAGVDYEVILVDDGSDDGTREFVRTVEHPKLRLMENAENLGFAGSNNRGAAAAKGEVLAFLNNDLVLRENWLDPMLAELDESAGMVGNVQVNARTGRVDHAGIVFTPWGIPEHWGQDYCRVPRRGARSFRAVTAACAVVRKEVFDAAGGFDEAYRNGFEDIDLCLRLGESGKVNRVAFESRVGHWISASPGRKGKDDANIRRFLQRWGDQTEVLGLRDWPRHYLRRHFRCPWRLNGRKTLDALSLWTGLRSSPPQWMKERAASLRKQGVPNG